MGCVEIVTIKHSEVPVGFAEKDINQISDNVLVRKRTGDLAVLGPFVFPYPAWVQVLFGGP